VLSIIHASIPNHWVPLVAISKAQNWSRNETLWITTITGIAHSISTILVGVIVGLVGYRLSSTYEFITRVVAPLILVILGFIYLIIGLKNSHYYQYPIKINLISQRSKLFIIVFLSISMFFSPCIEIEVYYFIAGTVGWFGIFVVSIVYLIITVFSMIFIVDLGRKGIEKVRCSFLGDHEKTVTGLVLIILGVAAYLIE